MINRESDHQKVISLETLPYYEAKKMQLNSMTDDISEEAKAVEFAEWILNIGDATNTSA
jgi:hypothetical protein